MTKLTCSYFNDHRCRSCSLLSSEQSERNPLKINKLLSTTSSILEPETEILDLFQSQSIFPSRAKAKLSVSGDAKNPTIGLIDKDFNGIELLSCPLHLESINKLLADLKNIIITYKLTPYDIETRKGELKGIIINSNSDESEMMLRFILRSTEAIPRIKKAVIELKNNHPSLKVITANIQAIPHQILEGDEEHVISEDNHIWECYNDVFLCLGPKSFSQVTPDVAKALYRYVQKIIEQKKPKLLLDVFCGVGGFALSSAKYSKEVIGVEFSDSAVNSAKLSAKKNQIHNATFLASDAEVFLENFKRTPCAIICNPPRRGLSKEILSSIKHLSPKCLIYSSCNPETLSRDLALVKEGYKLLSLAPFDMFPLTEHLEVVAVLEKR